MSSNQAPHEPDQLSGLQRAHIRTLPCDDAEAQSLYEHARREFGSDFVGLAWTTDGVKRLPGDQAHLTADDFRRVYELRLWKIRRRPICPAEEFRWVNGVGAVHLIVQCGADDTGAPDSPGTPCDDSSPEDEPQEQRCWVRRVTYLQHPQKTEGPVKRPASGDQKDQASRSTMEAIEVFKETKHGNLAYFDQLMTGSWNSL